MRGMEMATLAAHLQDLAGLYALAKDERRAAAYAKAAESVARVKPPPGAAAELAGVPGVGPSVTKDAEEFFATGTSARFGALLASLPPGLLGFIKELSALHGFGVATASALHERGYRSLRDVWCGVGDVPPAEITPAQRAGILFREHLALRIPVADAARAVGALAPLLPPFTVGGSFARATAESPPRAKAGASWRIVKPAATVGDLDFYFQRAPGVGVPEVVDALRAGGVLAALLESGRTVARTIVWVDGLHAFRGDFFVFEPEEAAAAALHYTGPRSFNVLMRTRAIELGFRLSNKGLFAEGGRRVPAESEGEIFRALRVVFVPRDERDAVSELETY